MLIVLIQFTDNVTNVPVVSFRSLEHNTRDGSADLTALAKWRILNRLHDRNETLYYKVNLICGHTCQEPEMYSMM
jgi:hypothetical protein